MMHNDDPELLRAEIKTDPDHCALCELPRPTHRVAGSFLCKDCIGKLNG